MLSFLKHDDNQKKMELICDTRYAFIVTTMNSKTSVCPRAVNIQLIMSNKTCHTQ